MEETMNKQSGDKKRKQTNKGWDYRLEHHLLCLCPAMTIASDGVAEATTTEPSQLS